MRKTSTRFTPVQHPTIQPAKTVEQARARASNPSIVQAAAVEPEKFKWGANMKNLGISVACGLLVWFLPAPAGVSAQAWHLLAIFISTIVGIITTPLPLGAVAMIGLAVSMVTQTLTFTQAFSAFSSEIPCASNSYICCGDRGHAYPACCAEFVMSCVTLLSLT
jgi:hypothetical protein